MSEFLKGQEKSSEPIHKFYMKLKNLVSSDRLNSLPLEHLNIDSLINSLTSLINKALDEDNIEKFKNFIDHVTSLTN